MALSSLNYIGHYKLLQNLNVTKLSIGILLSHEDESLEKFGAAQELIAFGKIGKQAISLELFMPLLILKVPLFDLPLSPFEPEGYAIDA